MVCHGHTRPGKCLMNLVVMGRVERPASAHGIINLVSWPMMLLSGVWYSLEEAPKWLRIASEALPLTQMLEAARAIMLDGASMADILPQLAALLAMTTLFLAMAGASSRWRAD